MMNEKIKNLIRELEELEKYKTKGDWIYDTEKEEIITGNKCWVNFDTTEFVNENDVKYLIVAVNAVPELIKEIKRLQAYVDGELEDVL